MGDLLEKYIASIYLSSVGDQFGFYNNVYIIHKNNIKTNRPDYQDMINGFTSNIIYKFINHGGFTGFNIKDYSHSFVTYFNIDVIKGFINDFDDNKVLYDNIVNNYIDTYDNAEKIYYDDYMVNIFKNIKAKKLWEKFNYNLNNKNVFIGTMCIGLVYHKKTDLNKLIETSIMITSITNQNCISFIGGIVSALFTSYAINNIHIEKWIFELVKLLETDTIDNILSKIKPKFIDFFKEAKKIYLHKLLTYIETSFDNSNYSIGLTRSVYASTRTEYYHENFADDKKIFYPGNNGDDCIIIAYDCLLMSKDNYEKLIYTSTKMIANTESIGSLASMWYGAYYGFKNIPYNIYNPSLKSLEEYKIFENFGINIFNKFTINK
jgi:ADP-ribosylglycohydrolase